MPANEVDPVHISLFTKDGYWHMRSTPQHPRFAHIVNLCGSPDIETEHRVTKVSATEFLARIRSENPSLRVELA